MKYLSHNSEISAALCKYFGGSCKSEFNISTFQDCTHLSDLVNLSNVQMKPSSILNICTWENLTWQTLTVSLGRHTHLYQMADTICITWQTRFMTVSLDRHPKYSHITWQTPKI